jgi:hypothetical protein
MEPSLCSLELDPLRGKNQKNVAHSRGGSTSHLLVILGASKCLEGRMEYNLVLFEEAECHSIETELELVEQA